MLHFPLTATRQNIGLRNERESSLQAPDSSKQDWPACIIVVFKAPGGMHGEGKVACAAFFGSWFTAFPDAHVEVEAVHIIDDLAVEEGTFTGTHNGVLRGPMGDIPPTARFVKVDYIQVLRFRDGKHLSFNLMFDRLMMLEHLGLVPAPAEAA
jgi:predicted ester cyclase